ncbi:unnamed protein product [Adineta ricciae]|uniref:Uncharacterized protein n=1 Tax=Adineta ricciae TaxID=249248 RepID=A0A814H8H3_ADIRI|nr:unnamed protein product [Adineta ricciae]
MVDIFYHGPRYFVAKKIAICEYGSLYHKLKIIYGDMLRNNHRIINTSFTVVFAVSLMSSCDFHSLAHRFTLERRRKNNFASNVEWCFAEHLESFSHRLKLEHLLHSDKDFSFILKRLKSSRQIIDNVIRRMITLLIESDRNRFLYLWREDLITFSVKLGERYLINCVFDKIFFRQRILR